MRANVIASCTTTFILKYKPSPKYGNAWDRPIFLHSTEILNSPASEIDNTSSCSPRPINLLAKNRNCEVQVIQSLINKPVSRDLFRIIIEGVFDSCISKYSNAIDNIN